MLYIDTMQVVEVRQTLSGRLSIGGRHTQGLCRWAWFYCHSCSVDLYFTCYIL